MFATVWLVACRILESLNQVVDNYVDNNVDNELIMHQAKIRLDSRVKPVKAPMEADAVVTYRGSLMDPKAQTFERGRLADDECFHDDWRGHEGSQLERTLFKVMACRRQLDYFSVGSVANSRKNFGAC